MASVEISHRKGSTQWCSGTPGMAMRIQFPDSFEATLGAARGVVGKGADVETAVGECLHMAASNSARTGFALPEELAAMSARDLGKIAVNGQVPDVSIVHLPSGYRDLPLPEKSASD